MYLFLIYFQERASLYITLLWESCLCCGPMSDRSRVLLQEGAGVHVQLLGMDHRVLPDSRKRPQGRRGRARGCMGPLELGSGQWWYVSWSLWLPQVFVFIFVSKFYCIKNDKVNPSIWHPTWSVEYFLYFSKYKLTGHCKCISYLIVFLIVYSFILLKSIPFLSIWTILDNYYM